MSLKDYIAIRRQKIEHFITTHISKVSSPKVFAQSLLYSFTAGGKRIRPILCLAAFEACCKDSDEIIPYASAIEFVHTYSLIHDDLPAMDNDDLRRGKLTNHKVFGDAMAILAGDGLLTEAFAILSCCSFAPQINPVSLLSAINELANAAGIYGMVAGQAQDLLSENSVPDPDILSFIHCKKTAALLTASVKIGAILANADDTKMSALTEYGQNIGLAFQIVDDILDVEGDTAQMGKPQGSDEKSNKMTWPVVYGMTASKLKAEELLNNAVKSISTLGEPAQPLREIAQYLNNRKN